MCAAAPIFLFTDFGSADIYVGQVRAVLYARSPGSVVIDLTNDLPAFAVPAAAHLLAALSPQLPPGAVTICVVDPGVGSIRAPVAVNADGRWYVGPDNGLMSVVAARSTGVACYALAPLDGSLSASFHGRDLFAPHAALLAAGSASPGAIQAQRGLDVELGPDDLREIIYIDHYGNAITGIRASRLAALQRLTIKGQALKRARVFSDVAAGDLFCYENSIGLMEIAANQSSAARLLGLTIGDEVRLD
jgi:S-adenosylmethionine hydrolase